MTRLRSLAAILAAGVLLAGCASPTVPTVAVPSATTGAISAAALSAPPAPTASAPSPAASTAHAPEEAPSASPSPLAVWLDASPDPAFAGDRVVFAVGDPDPAVAGLPVSSATVGFGDGSSATATAACTAGLTIAHTYRRGGAFVARVTAVTLCDPAAGADLSGAWANVRVYPSAPIASAKWPACGTYALHMGGGFTGAGLGNVETQITLRNVGRRGCVLEGYPGVVLLAADGSRMPTHAAPATTGAYMFPAVAPHRVALEPGATATFMLAYTDNPSGGGEGQPYALACPPSAAVRVILPGTRQFGTAGVPMGVCGGVLRVSPIVPGADRIQFP